MSDPSPRHPLALTRWEAGQILQPQHFFAQEEALLGTTIETARLAGLPFYGVGRLAWDTDLLAQGTVSIRQLTVVFGPAACQLVAVPENADLPPFTLDAPGPTATLHLSLLTRSRRETEVVLYRENVPVVAREVRLLGLSTTRAIDDSVASIQLATLEKKDGKWGLSDSYVPPLLRVGTSDFLVPLLDEIAALAATLSAGLRVKLRDDFFRGESMAVARRCQLGAYRLRTILSDMHHGVCRHPYFYLEALRAFYLELCLLKNLEPDEPDPPFYDHDRLASCFKAVAGLIKARSDVATVSSPSLPFARDGHGSRFVAKDFDRALLDATEVYVVVQRPDPGKPVAFEGFKLASRSRLDTVHTRSLRGVRFNRVDASFQHTFGPGVDLYRIQPGEEWSQALSERTLAYYAPAGLEDVDVALFWRSP